MPELPEIELYLDALTARVQNRVIEGLRIRSPSFLRTYDPPASRLVGRRVKRVFRLSKRVVFETDHPEDGPDSEAHRLYAAVHLMLTGRFQWKPPGAAVPRKRAHGAFDFENGTLLITEQATTKRAALHVVVGREALDDLHRGGVEPLEASLDEFKAALARESRTLKRALTDQRLVSGVGNAHSDEILLQARLSPLKLTSRLSDEETERLYAVTRESLERWTRLLKQEWGTRWPTKITAFHPEMAAHGKYGEPCPQCGSPIQRITYASRETNYCATCQTGGKLLADRAMSRLLKQDWPRSLEELEEHVDKRRAGPVSPSIPGHELP